MAYRCSVGHHLRQRFAPSASYQGSFRACCVMFSECLTIIFISDERECNEKCCRSKTFLVLFFMRGFARR